MGFGSDTFKVKIVGDDKGLSATASHSGRTLKKLAKDGESSNKTLEVSAMAVTRSYRLVAGAVGLVAAGIGGFTLGRVIEETVRSTRETEAWAKAVGVSTQSLMQWNYAGEQVGLQQGKLGDIFKDVGDKIGDAYANNSGEAVDALKNLNLTASELVNLSPDEKILKIASALDNVKSHDVKVQILESLGNDASLLLPLLENNAAEFRRLAQEANDTGYALSNIDAEKLNILGAEFSRLKAEGTGAGNALTVALAPAIHGITTELGHTIDSWGGVGKITEQAVDIAVTGVGFILDRMRDVREILKLSEIGWLTLGSAGVDAFVNTGQAGIDLVNKILHPIAQSIGFIIGGYAKLIELVARVTGNDSWHRAAEAVQGFADGVSNVKISMDDVVKLQDRLHVQIMNARNELQDLINSNAPSDELRAWLEKNRKELEALAKAANDANNATAGQSKDGASLQDVKAHQDAVAQIYKDTATSIRGAFRGAFRDMLDGQNTFVDRAKNLFKDMLADMATLAVARPIIIPLVTSFGGALGVPGAAQAQVVQQLGGSALSSGLGSAAGAAGLSTFGTFGAGLSAGLQGGFGAASAIGANTTLSTTLGAYAGAALPWVAGGLVLDNLTGGGLFGTGWKTKDSGLQLDYAGGQLDALNYEIQKKKKSLFRGSRRRTQYSAADQKVVDFITQALGLGSDALSAGAGAFGVTNAADILAGFSRSGRVNLKGKNEQEAQAAIQKWLDETIVQMATQVFKNTNIEALVTGASRATVDAILNIGQYLAANPIIDAAEQLRLANRTLKQVYDDQTAAVMGLAQAFDGSEKAATDLAAATQQRYQAELQLMQQLASVRDSVLVTFGTSIQNIRESVMSPAQLYASLSGQASSLVDQLGSANSAEAIAQIVSQINSTTNRAYNLLPDAQKQTLSSDYIAFLQDAQDLATSRLTAIENDIKATHDALAEAIRTSMDQAASNITQASQTLQAAADTLQQATDHQLALARRSGLA